MLEGKINATVFRRQELSHDPCNLPFRDSEVSLNVVAWGVGGSKVVLNLAGRGHAKREIHDASGFVAG